MKTLKKIWKSIAKKFKNSTTSKKTAIQDPKVSSSKDLLGELSEDILKTTIEQTATTIPEYSKEVHKRPVVDNTSTNTKLCNINSETHQPMHGSSEGAQNDSIETSAEEPCFDREATAEPCFDSDAAERPLTQQKKVITINPELKAKLVDDLVWEEECKDSLTILLSIGDSEVADSQLIYEKSATASIETAIQEPNTPDSLSSAESRFDATDEKDKPLTTQAVIFGSIGAALLVSSVVAYILKMYAIAVIGGIVGLACVSYALYNALKPGTKLEKVEDVERLDEKPLPSL